MSDDESEYKAYLKGESFFDKHKKRFLMSKKHSIVDPAIKDCDTLYRSSTKEKERLQCYFGIANENNKIHSDAYKKTEEYKKINKRSDDLRKK